MEIVLTNIQLITQHSITHTKLNVKFTITLKPEIIKKFIQPCTFALRKDYKRNFQLLHYTNKMKL